MEGPVVIGGDSLPSPLGIGLTDLPNIGGASGPLAPQFGHHCIVSNKYGMYIVHSKLNDCYKHIVGVTSQKKQLEMVTKLNLLFCELARKNMTFCAMCVSDQWRQLTTIERPLALAVHRASLTNPIFALPHSIYIRTVRS